MSLHKDFASITDHLRVAIVERNVAFPEFRFNQGLVNLTQNFMEMAANADITPTDLDKSASLPCLRIALSQLHDATSLWKSDEQTRHYAQNTVNALKPFMAE